MCRREAAPARPFASRNVFVAGDFNQSQELTDPILTRSGAVNALDSLAAEGREQARRARRASMGTAPVDLDYEPDALPGSRHRIDLAYEAGMRVVDAGFARVPRVESPLMTSDHALLYFDAVPRGATS